MKINYVLILSLLVAFQTLAQERDEVLWYRYPAREWEEALPVGNGRLGGMIFGTIDRERISLNEETIWSFPFKPVTATSETQYLIKKQRELIFQGKYKEADKLKVQDLDIPRDVILKEQIEGHVYWTKYLQAAGRPIPAFWFNGIHPL